MRLKSPVSRQAAAVIASRPTNPFLKRCTLTLIAGGVFTVTFAHGAAPGRFAVYSPLRPVLAGTAQGYLGVGIADVDNDRAAVLKLKEVRGAEIITVDQDAPAAKAGLKTHDVVIQMNDQRIDNVEQFRKMLRETPPGRTVSLVAIREGQPVNLSALLGDRATLARDSMKRLNGDPNEPGSESGTATAPPHSSRRYGGVSTFLPSFSRSQPYVGLALQPLTTQLAEYFGVHRGSGLLVESVFPGSPGAAAGLKVADVIQSINGQPIVSASDWERAIRANRGKQVQLVIVREKKEQTVSLVAGEAKNSSEVNDAGSGSTNAALLAELRTRRMD